MPAWHQHAGERPLARRHAESGHAVVAGTALVQDSLDPVTLGLDRAVFPKRPALERAGIAPGLADSLDPLTHGFRRLQRLDFLPARIEQLVALSDQVRAAPSSSAGFSSGGADGQLVDRFGRLPATAQAVEKTSNNNTAERHATYA